ncbi:MAG: hypothetical protein RRY33_00370 [Alistipes sp.]
MKKLKDTIRFFAAALLLCTAAVTIGCSDDEPATQPVTEGVVFEFSMRTVYGLSTMTDIGSVKITLAQDGKNFELPSLRLSGDDKLVASQPCRLAAGNYTFVSYIAYAKNADQLFKAELDEDNAFEVKANELTTFDLPLSIRVVEFPQDAVRNALKGLCLELFGDNEELWPWDFAEEDLRDMQKRHHETPYVEYDEDDYGNINYIASVHFTGEDFAEVTEFPLLPFANLKTLSGLTFTELPNLKTLKDLDKLDRLNVLTMVNTGIEALPEQIGKCKELVAINLTNNKKLTTISAAISSLKDLRMVDLSGNQITSFDVSLKASKGLESLDLSRNPLTTFGDGVLDASQKISHLKFSNTQLSSLPAVIGQITTLRGIELAGCQFTALPAAVKNNANLQSLWFSGSTITSLNAADFSGMTKLESLMFSDMKLASAPALNIPSLVMLAMNNCGLTAVPNVAQLPNLSRLDLNGNNITTGSLDFTAKNPKLKMLSINHSAAASLPEIKVLMANGKPAHFALLDVSDCPNLRLTTPGEWNSYDFRLGDLKGDAFEEVGGLKDDGRVAVCRTNSTHVTFGDID